MPFPARNQVMESSKSVAVASGVRADGAAPARPAGGRSRLRRLLVRVSASSERAPTATVAVPGEGKDKEEAAKEEVVEVGSVCLDRMVQSYMEEVTAEAARPPRNRCNCFNGNTADESSDDEWDFFDSVPTPAPAAATGEPADILKGLAPCATVAERNLLADTTKIVEKARKNKVECRRAVADGLKALGYDAALCKSKWDKSSSIPSGEHEYIDVINAGDGRRIIVEVDFRSEFEVARPTKTYRAALQALPSVYVGTPERLSEIVAVVTEAAMQSLKKKGLHFPPWRRPEYMRSKWLSPHQRAGGEKEKAKQPEGVTAATTPCSVSAVNFSGEFELRFGSSQAAAKEGDRITVVVSPWRPPEAKPKAKLVTGLSFVL